MGIEPSDRWQVRVDTGGTFTDCVAIDPGGETRRAKALSSSALRARIVEVEEGGAVILDGLEGLASGRLGSWTLRCPGREHGGEMEVEGWEREDRRLFLRDGNAERCRKNEVVELLCPGEAPVLATHLALGVPWGGRLPVLDLRLSTTLGTNALLERRGAPTALLVTRGFRDLLRIGDQSRPELFALEIEKPEPYCREVVEVDERMDAGGEILREIDLEALGEEIEGVLETGVRSAAVSLLHAYRNGDHERRAAELLRREGFEHVSVSHELSPLLGYLERTRTTLVDAYLAPILGRYLKRIRDALSEGSRILVMTSAGGLLGIEAFRPKDGLLSGPAAGVVGAGRAGTRSGRDRLLTFDMGGTSTDVSRWAGEASLVFEHRVGDAVLQAPAVAVETVAAGGGSRCWFDGDRLRVGPESGGADPGPACYGAGGPLCLTDVNLLLGRIDPRGFHLPVDRDAARARLSELHRSIELRPGEDQAGEELLEGFRRIADERMAETIRRVSVRRGFDPSEHVLLAFGGAGGQHACAVAELLEIREILVPRDAGLLSAVGLGAARLERVAAREILEALDRTSGTLRSTLRELEEEAGDALRARGLDTDRLSVPRRLAFLRFRGQDERLEIPIPEGDRASEPELVGTLRRRFRDRYRELYGYLPPEREVELVTLRVVVGAPAEGVETAAEGPVRDEPEPVGELSSRFEGRWLEVPVFDRGDLEPGEGRDGPAVVREAHGTTVVEPGWRWRVDGAGALTVQRIR